MAVFGIFHCAHSGRYTDVTLASFLKYTELGPNDELIVLDNDGDFKSENPQVRVIQVGGRTFAQNVNDILSRALERHTAAFCLNNDLLFTSGWRAALDQVGTSIAAPLHHHNATVKLGEVTVPPHFDLDFYHVHQNAFEQFSETAPRIFTRRVHQRVWLPSFSCFRVSPEVISRLGPMDERFANGGEDTDYAIRAHLQGIDCLACHDSFVFHFGGKSTYKVDSSFPIGEEGSGAFLQRPLQQREQQMRQTFESKWGERLSGRLLFKNFVGPDGVESAGQTIRAELADDGLAVQDPICSIPEFQQPNHNDSKHLYIDLLKKSLANVIYGDGGWLNHEEKTEFKPEVRRVGLDWPNMAHTMIGTQRLDNLQFCLEDVLRRGVPGDVIETGVWRGGATILMRGILKAHEIVDRRVWVADSFEGCPPPNGEKYPSDHIPFHEWSQLAISLEEVKSNFQKYDLLDSQVCFLKGWFKDTLPDAPIEQLALVRADGDLYESTMDVLVNLYPKLSPGGYLIVDDFRNIEACRKAVIDYRTRHQIDDEIHFVDWGGVYWRKGASHD